ncbi:MAG: hypothetical protein U0271_44475 [Polyangiaceae bacterium]
MKSKTLVFLTLALTACGSEDGAQRADAAPRYDPIAQQAPPGPMMHGRNGPGLMCLTGDGPLGDSVKAGVERALADEWRADDTYTSLAATFGRPFQRLERAEERHADLLVRLLATHGHGVPSRSAPVAPAAASAADACALALEAEKENVALYDELLAAGPPDDVRCVYEHLRSLSQERHIPALERCGGGPPGP